MFPQLYQWSTKTLNATLHGNLFVFLEINISVIQQEVVTFSDSGETFYINSLKFVNASYLIFGLNVFLTVSPNPGSELSPEEIVCAIVFLTVDFKSVLASNRIRYRAQILAKY